MAKRLTVIEKKEMVNDFINGEGIDALSKKFQCAKSTIIRNLKNNLDPKEYNFLIIKNKNEKIMKIILSKRILRKLKKT